jgi:hypothetical protein
MIMQKIMQLKLFQLLLKTSQNEDFTSKLEESYEEFALKVLFRLQMGTKHAELYYSFGFVHLKLAGICERLSSGQGKKCLRNRNQSYALDRIGYADIGMANYDTEQ